MLAMIFSFASCAGGVGGQGGKKSITVYNWGDYIDETVLDDFEKEYGINVNYDMFTTNEDMYVKLKSGGSSYDVIFPSDYMIARLIKEDRLQKIDMSKITNYKNIGDEFKNLGYDPNNEYSVPYMWGTVGILYNTTMVDEPVDSWNILWDPKYAKNIFMHVFFKKGSKTVKALEEKDSDPDYIRLLDALKLKPDYTSRKPSVNTIAYQLQNL
jgi:spermidine/putrescine transport system substrate-binding protein